MDQIQQPERWPSLQKSDEQLLEELQAILTARVTGDPYGRDGDAFSRSIAELPRGLRAMAATHWLDFSLTIDSMTWHFGNFGEPGLVAQTEAGLLELGLPELAACFHEAAEFVIPLLGQCGEEEDPSDFWERIGVTEKIDALDNRGWELRDTPEGESAIYTAWVRYTRQHPEHVFGV